MRPKLKELQGKTKKSSLTSNIPTKTRNWDKYKDQSKLSLIDSVRCMTYDDAYKITNNESGTKDSRRRTGACYWLDLARFCQRQRLLEECVR